MIKLQFPIEQKEGEAGDVCCVEISDEMQHAQTAARQAMKAAEPQLHARIREYIRARGHGSKIGPSPFPRTKRSTKAAPKIGGKRAKLIGDHFFDRYRSGNSTDRDIVAHAKRVSIGYCPYCGLSMRRKPRNISFDRDHVLPRSRYPEFSLMRLNIVLACDDCNDAKDAHVQNSHGQWLFLHPYFDNFLAIPLLKVVVALEQGVAVPKFSISDDLPAAIKDRAQLHFDALDLRDRYADDPLTRVAMVLNQHKAHVIAGSDIGTVRRILICEGFRELSARPNDPVGHCMVALGRSEHLNVALGIP